jgi:flagellar basal body-associated protein FliL
MEHEISAPKMIMIAIGVLLTSSALVYFTLYFLDTSYVEHSGFFLHTAHNMYLWGFMGVVFTTCFTLFLLLIFLVILFLIISGLQELWLRRKQKKKTKQQGVD